MENKQKLQNTLKLNDGTSIPLLGLGTSGVKDVGTIVYQSIKDGVRLIDTAAMYKNEQEIGEAIKKAINDKLVTREDLYIVTKLVPFDKQDPEKALKQQLQILQLDYVNLYLDHWPYALLDSEDDSTVNRVPLHVLWKSMENLVKKGLTKSIGVSNYNVQSMMNLLSFAEIKPVVNEYEFHPYLTQTKLREYCTKNDVNIIAYNSLVKGRYVAKSTEHNKDLLNEGIVKKLAEKYKVTEGNIALAFSVSQNVIAIPATSNPNRMKENLKTLEIRLSEEDIKELSGLDNHIRFCNSALWPPSKGVDMFA